MGEFEKSVQALDEFIRNMDVLKDGLAQFSDRCELLEAGPLTHSVQTLSESMETLQPLVESIHSQVDALDGYSRVAGRIQESFRFVHMETQNLKPILEKITPELETLEKEIAGILQKADRLKDPSHLNFADKLKEIADQFTHFETTLDTFEEKMIQFQDLMQDQEDTRKTLTNASEQLLKTNESLNQHSQQMQTQNDLLRQLNQQMDHLCNLPIFDQLKESTGKISDLETTLNSFGDRVSKLEGIAEQQVEANQSLLDSIEKLAQTNQDLTNYSQKVLAESESVHELIELIRNGNTDSLKFLQELLGQWAEENVRVPHIFLRRK